MRRAGRIVAGTIDAVLAAVAPGRSTLGRDRVAERFIRQQGAIPSFKGYRGTYPASICTSIDAEIVHGIPSATRKLKEGMVLSLDFGAIWEGFHGDAAVTVFVGGQAPSEEAAKLAKETEHALYAAIDAIRVGGRLSDIGHTIESVAGTAGTASAGACTRSRSSRTGARRDGALSSGRASRSRWSRCSPSAARRIASSPTGGPWSPPTDRWRPTSNTRSPSPRTAPRS